MKSSTHWLVFLNAPREAVLAMEKFQMLTIQNKTWGKPCFGIFRDGKAAVRAVFLKARTQITSLAGYLVLLRLSWLAKA